MAFYKVGGGNNPSGNATESDVLSGKTFSNDSGIDKVGTMPNNTSSFGNKQLTPASNSVTIPKGYHPGDKTVRFDMQSVSAQYAYRGESRTISYNTSGLGLDPNKAISQFTINPIRMTGIPYAPNKRSASINMYSDNGATSSPITDKSYSYTYLDTTKIPNTHTNDNAYIISYDNKDSIVTLADSHNFKKIDPSRVYNRGMNDGWEYAMGDLDFDIVERITGQGLVSRTITCDWNGALLVVQLQYDENLDMTPVEIEAINSEAQYAKPQYLEQVSSGALQYVVRPKQIRMHGNSDDSNRAQFWMSWLYNIKYGAKFRISQMGASSNAADSIQIFKVSSTQPIETAFFG